MKVQILTVKAKPFKGTEGDQIMYFWYDAKRVTDGVTFQFGSVREYTPGEEVEAEIIKTENKFGRVMWKEVA